MRPHLLALLATTTLATAAEPLRGPFTLADGLTFYIVNQAGTALDLKVRWTDPARKSYPRPTLIRVFDPEENLLLRHEFAGAVVSPVPWEEAALRVEARAPGVYQVIVTGWDGGQVEVTTSPTLPFGVAGHFQSLAGRGAQFAETYVFLPPGLDTLPVSASRQFESLSLQDGEGQERLRLDRDRKSGEVALPAGDARVWRLSASGADYRLDVKGFPIILCPDVESARAIHASVEVMPDGTLCFHKHQVAAWKLLQQYRQRPASEYAVAIRPLEDVEAALLRDPGRNAMLFGHYGVFALLPPILHEQNLDPVSPWFGAIRSWKTEGGAARDGNPLADYNRGGLDSFAGLTKDLAALYWLKAEFNPYYHDPGLLNRIIVGILLDQMVLREDERVKADNTYYYGIHGFALCHEHSGAFSLVYRDVPPEVQAVWHAGQQRLTDRAVYGTVGGCVNQWTVLLQALWRTYEGTGEEFYQQAFRRNLGWLIAGTLWDHGQRAAGYMTEASGPDATYNGITGHQMAYFFHAAKDPEILASLQRCYRLFNHTVAVEPDGTWLGSSGYCHRTPGDWTSPQYGAGLGPMAAVLPEAGLRLPDHPAWATARPVATADQRSAAEAEFRKTLKYFPEDHFDAEPANFGRALGAFDILFANWRHSGAGFLPGLLPCQEKGPFVRDFGNEFLCVKRSGYYAFLYAGKAFGEWQSGGRPQQYNRQFPHNDGLCLFWSPEFGVSLLSKNWGAAQANTLLADLGGGRIEWPWYWSVKHQFDTDKAEAWLEGTIHDTPLHYRRLYRFLPEGVQCDLTVTAEKALSLAALNECLPYPLAAAKPGGLTATLIGADGTPAAAGPARAIHLSNAGGQGHLLRFAADQRVDLGQDHSTDHYHGEHDWGRALVALPREWTAGQTATLTYWLQPCPLTGIAAALK
jgi:hypothetical protein